MFKADKAMIDELNVRWKVSKCNVVDCWCAWVEPENPIKDKDGFDIWIIPTGTVSKAVANHIVDAHNKSISQTRYPQELRIVDTTSDSTIFNSKKTKP